jgi:ribonuclease HI
MEHALHECPAWIWETTMGCWEKLRGEHLDHKDVRVTLLGDRRSAPGILPITAREEMFRALHASTLHALVENWRQQRHATKPKRRDTRTTLQRARRVLDDTVRTRWRALRRAGKEEEFHDTWVLSGAVVMRRGEPVTRIFQLDKEPKPPPEGAIIASGDGAGPVHGKKRKAAGWGGIVMAPAINGRAEPEVKMLAGPVITEEDDERYDGADAPTNTAGELIAKIRMIQESVRIAQPGDHVEVQSDSMVALMAALGARKLTRRKKGPRSKSRKKSNMGLQQRLRAVYTSARRKLRTTKITLRKVKGHSRHVWNEIADELAAMGRGMTDALDAGLPEATAELIDRYARAIFDGLGGSVQLECNGFDLWGDGG